MYYLWQNKDNCLVSFVFILVFAFQLAPFYAAFVLCEFFSPLWFILIRISCADFAERNKFVLFAIMRRFDGWQSKFVS